MQQQERTADYSFSPCPYSLSCFACEPPDDPTETESVVLLRRCSVWKHGIAWWTNDGIEVIVEVGLQCRWVAVMMCCPDDKRLQWQSSDLKLFKLF